MKKLAMQFALYKPDPSLNHLVKQYWLLQIEDSPLKDPQFLFPVGAVELVFHLEHPFLRRHAHTWVREENAFIEGQHKGSLLLRQTGKTCTFGITLYPWATYMFNIEPNALTNNSYELSALPKNANDLYHRLVICKHVLEMVELADNYLKPLAASYSTNRSAGYEAITHAFQKLYQPIHLHDLKKTYSFSSRQFEIKFKELVGIAPKLHARKARMGRAIRLMGAKNPESLTRIAYEAGFYDQSHFINEFRGYFQSSPGRIDAGYLLQNFS